MLGILLVHIIKIYLSPAIGNERVKVSQTPNGIEPFFDLPKLLDYFC